MTMLIRPDETIEQFVIRRCWETGHFWGPENMEGWAVRQQDLSSLRASDDVVIKAIQSFVKTDVLKYAKIVEDEHGRLPDFDGEIGPAVSKFAQINRCMVPDFRPPPEAQFAFEDRSLQRVVERMQQVPSVFAAGSGNWRGCHDVGDFHCVVIRWDMQFRPAHLPLELFTEILKQVQFAYAAVGLLIRFTDQRDRDLLNGEDLSDLHVNIEASFVQRSDGWIGLAIVGRGEGCSTQPIWCRYLATYRGGGSREQIILNWGSLLMHEIGHNCGRLHTNGGIMNPSLEPGLPNSWAPGDPSTNWMRQQFGGIPVPLPDDDDDTPPRPPSPPEDTEEILERLRVQVLINELNIRGIKERLRVLES